MRPTRVFLRPAWVIVCLLALVALTACANRAPEFVTSATTYSSETATKLLRATESGKLTETPAAEGPKLRQESLSDLRGEEGGDEAADFITKTFPSDLGGVPVYVERARYGDEPAWLIVEAIGREGGTLADKRLWVVSADGDVLFSAID